MKSKKTNHNHKSAPSHETTLDRTLKASFWGLLITVGISLALMLSGTGIAFMTDDPTAFVDPIGYVALFTSAFFGGFACCKLNRSSSYLTSALTGAYFVILSMLLSFAIPHEFSSKMDIFLRLGLHMLTFVTFLVGCFASQKAGEPKKRKKRR